MKNEPQKKKYRKRPESRYKKIERKGKMVREHRWVWEQANGPIPKGYEIHHINFKPKDNRLENLEILTPSEHRRKHFGWVKNEDGSWLKPCRRCKELKDLKTCFRKYGSRCKPCTYEAYRVGYLEKKAQSPVTA